MKMLTSVLALVLSLALVAPAFADNTGEQGGSLGVLNIIGDSNTTTNTISNTGVGAGGTVGGAGGEGGSGGSGGKGGSATATGGNARSQGGSVNSPVQDRIPATVVAPGLAAAGTGVCLGSFSVGISGPMAGLAFGKTQVDKGCERRSGAALLYQMGYRDAALRLLSNDPEIAEALNPTPATVAPVSINTDEPLPQFGVQAPSSAVIQFYLNGERAELRPQS